MSFLVHSWLRVKRALTAQHVGTETDYIRVDPLKAPSTSTAFSEPYRYKCKICGAKKNLRANRETRPAHLPMVRAFQPNTAHYKTTSTFQNIPHDPSQIIT